MPEIDRAVNESFVLVVGHCENLAAVYLKARKTTSYSESYVELRKLRHIRKVVLFRENHVVSRKLRHIRKVTSYPESWYFAKLISMLC